MSQNPVSQARENLDRWMAASRRAGESVHWRQLNRHIASLSNLTQFRKVNAENAMKEEGRLGLDSARLDQESETQLVLDRLLSHWSFTEVAGLLESRVGSPPQFDVRSTDGQSLKTDVHDLHMVNFALTFCRFLSSNRTLLQQFWRSVVDMGRQSRRLQSFSRRSDSCSWTCPQLAGCSRTI